MGQPRSTLKSSRTLTSSDIFLEFTKPKRLTLRQQSVQWDQTQTKPKQKDTICADYSEWHYPLK